MEAVNYYEHHLGDYARDAGHLSMLREGAYRRLIDAYYAREKALPVDLVECCELARCTSKPERDAVKYLLDRFFELRQDGYHQKRCDEEINRFKAKSKAAKASANARWSNSERNANASANGMRTHSDGNADGMLSSLQSPIPSNQSPHTPDPDPDPDPSPTRPRGRSLAERLAELKRLDAEAAARNPKPPEPDPDQGSVCGTFKKLGGG